MIKEQQIQGQSKKLAHKLDQSCKILLSNKKVLAHILKEIIQEFKHVSVKTIARKYIEGPTLVKNGLKHPNAKYIQGITNDQTDERYDIYFKVRLPGKNEIRSVFVNIEAQENFYPGYSKVRRGIYYAACMIANQYGIVFTHSDYDAIEKVYSIWICPNPPLQYANTMTSYEMKETCVDGNYQEEEKNYDMIGICMLNCGGNKNERYKGNYRMVDVLLSSDEKTKNDRIRILKQEYDISIDEDMKGAMRDMCTYGESIYYDGVHNGIQQGVQQGKTQTMLLAIRGLMKSMNWSAEEAMDKLGVPEADRETFKALLKQ